MDGKMMDGKMMWRGILATMPSCRGLLRIPAPPTPLFRHSGGSRCLDSPSPCCPPATGLRNRTAPAKVAKRESPSPSSRHTGLCPVSDFGFWPSALPLLPVAGVRTFLGGLAGEDVAILPDSHDRLVAGFAGEGDSGTVGDKAGGPEGAEGLVIGVGREGTLEVGVVGQGIGGPLDLLKLVPLHWQPDTGDQLETDIFPALARGVAAKDLSMEIPRVGIGGEHAGQTVAMPGVQPIG